MKNIFLLFIILPVFAFSQQSSSKQWFELGFLDKPADLDMWYANYTFLVIAIANEMGYNHSKVKYLTPENFNNIRFGTLPEGKLAQARAVNNDCRIEIVINRNEWFKASQEERMWIYYHEMAHDTFNLDHGEGGELMNPYAPNNRITKQRLYLAIKNMIQYAIKFGKYNKGLAFGSISGYCENGNVRYVSENRCGELITKNEDGIIIDKREKNKGYEFGMSRAELINEKGNPEYIKGKNKDNYTYLETDNETLRGSLKMYFFNDYDELKEVRIMEFFKYSSNLKNFILEKIECADAKYDKGVLDDKNKNFIFTNNDSNSLYIIQVTPNQSSDKKDGDITKYWSKETYINARY